MSQPVQSCFRTQMLPLLSKEFLEAWRDRRALMTAILAALILPLILTGLTVFMVKTQTEKDVRVALLGAETVPLLQQQLQTERLRLELLAGGQPEQLLQQGYDLVLEVGANFNRDYESFRSPSLYLYTDSSKSSAGRAQRRLQVGLNRLQQMVLSQRLAARGVAAQLLVPWKLQLRDVSTPSKRSMLLLMMVPGLLILTLVFASLATAVDTSAGERERLSLEILLHQPIPAWQIMFAKTLVTASFGWFGALLSLVALALLMPLMPLAELGIQQAIRVAGVVAMAAILLPLALLLAVLQILLALRSQSFKDAQARLGIFQVAPLLLLMALGIAEVELAGYWQLLPLVGQQQWLKALLVGDSVPLGWTLAGSLVCLLLTAVAVWSGAQALRRESLLNAV